jgi:V8-like Glu-specific endopeptidase
LHRDGIKVRALAAAIAVVVAGGCSSVPAASHPHAAGGGLPGYWTKSRFLGARPMGGVGYQQANAHPVRCQARPAGCLPAGQALRVGALFFHGVDGSHYCTASVVASPGRDLLITAAHCINSGKGGGYRQDIVFVPDYRDGQAPFGMWNPARLVVAPQWASSSDPSLDVGFIVLKPHDGENIQQVLGGSQLRIDSGYRFLVRVTGYPASGSAPVTCVHLTSRQSASQLRFDCGGYTGGTSGSPWVTHLDPLTRTGTIVGVIGGYQQGGDTPAISYSAYLGDAVQRLYQQAVADEAAATA